MTYFPFFLSLFQTNTCTRTCTARREERVGKLQNLHSSLFKQHLFSNDRSTLRGEWESIFNWMFTWGRTSGIWIRLLDHMHFDTKNLRERSKPASNPIKSTTFLLKKKPQNDKNGGHKTRILLKPCKRQHIVAWRPLTNKNCELWHINSWLFTGKWKAGEIRNAFRKKHLCF